MFPYFRILYYKLNATRRISENSRPASEIKLSSQRPRWRERDDNSLQLREIFMFPYFNILYY